MKRTLMLLLGLSVLLSVLFGCTVGTVVLNRPTRKTVTQTLGGDAPTVTEYAYTYNSEGQLLLAETSHGARVEYIYENGRLVREVEVSRTADPDRVTEYIYDDDGRLAEKRLPTGVVCRYLYSDDGSLRREEYVREGSDTPSEVHEYTYSEDGELLSEVVSAYGDTDTWEYCYDENGRREGGTRTYRSAFGGVTVAEIAYTYSADGLLVKEEYRTLSSEGSMTLLFEVTVTEYFDYKSFALTQ